jgi:hypothetical protein
VWVGVNVKTKIPLPIIPSHLGRGKFDFKGEKRAQIKNKSRSSETIQEDRDWKDKDEKGICPTYLDKKIIESKTSSQIS